MRKASVAAAIAVVLIAGSAIADEVRKKDGTTIEGEVLEDTSDHVTIRNKLGDIKIPRKDVASVTKKQGVDLELDKLKRATAEKLEALAKQAEKNRPAAARALRATIDDVKKWELPTEDGDFTAETLDWSDIQRRQMRLENDASKSKFQQDETVEALGTKLAGRRVRARMRVNEVAPYRETWMSATGSVDEFKPTFFFGDEEEKKKVAKLKKGDEIVVEGTITIRARFSPGIGDARIAEVKLGK